MNRSTLETNYRALLPLTPSVGTVQQLAIRPSEGVHEAVDSLELTPEGGVIGDRWAKGSWMSLADGRPDPRVQVSVTNAKIMTLIAGSLEAGLECGDNLFVDFDLSEANLPVGSLLEIGSAQLKVSDVINDACGKFIQRFGQDAFEWIRDPANASRRLRGIFCQIKQAGQIRQGDSVRIIK